MWCISSSGGHRSNVHIASVTTIHVFPHVLDLTLDEDADTQLEAIMDSLTVAVHDGFNFYVCIAT